MKRFFEMVALMVIVIMAAVVLSVMWAGHDAEAARAGSRGPRGTLLDAGPSGRAVNYPYDEFVQSMKNDGVLHGGTNKIVDGTTLNLAAKWLAPNKCVRVETEGTWAGASAARSVRLTAMNGATATDLLTLAGATVVGDVQATFHLCGVGVGYTVQEIWARVQVNSGSTVVLNKVVRAAGSYTFSRATPVIVLKTRWASGAAGDVVTQKFAQYFMEP
jgi:hypothetical protein